MEITRKSLLSGITRTRELPITAEQWARFEAGDHIQKALAHLSESDREFILTGSTDEEWDDEFGEDDEDCPHCGGEGFVANCWEEYACIDPDGGCADCLAPCDYCNPRGPQIAQSEGRS